MPIYNREASVSNEPSGGGGGGGGPGEAELAELQAKRQRGNVTTDNIFGTTGALDSNPPPKARPRAHESHEEKPETEIDGFEVAVVPYAVQALDYEDLRAPYGGEDLEGVCEALYRLDEDAYDLAARNMHTLLIPSEFFPPDSAVRPFFQFLAAVAYGMKHRRRQLIHDIEAVTPWYERYCAELNYLREKQEKVAVSWLLTLSLHSISVVKLMKKREARQLVCLYVYLPCMDGLPCLRCLID